MDALVQCLCVILDAVDASLGEHMSMYRCMSGLVSLRERTCKSASVGSVKTSKFSSASESAETGTD